MPSPRVALSASAQSDVDRLLAADVDLSSLGKHPESDGIANATTNQLRSIAATIRCAALTVNTGLSEMKTDAVEVRIEHREGAALLVFLPYKRPRFGGGIDFGDLRAYPAAPDIWISAHPDMRTCGHADMTISRRVSP